MSKLIGIYGGTFDPVHFGHLRPVLDVKQALGLDRVLFLPNRALPDRDPPMFDVEQRKTLLEMAIHSIPGFELDTRELERETMSFMVDTLVSLRQDFPDDALCLILGMDAFSGLYQWHQWQKILDLCHIVVTTRPGFTWPDGPEMKSLEACKVADVPSLKAVNTGRILLQSVLQLEISSSYIRKQLRERCDIRYLLPEDVREKLLEIMRDS
jgi:nicotinate-nucleotide adenylyltransferase